MTKFSNFTMAADADASNSKNSKFLKLLDASKAGDLNARNQLLLSNMGLICKIASEVKRPFADKEDIIIDGCIRFLEIINDYDPARASLSTYIWNPIKQYMNETLPEYSKRLWDFLKQYNDVVEYLTDLDGKVPDIVEVAEFMGCSVEKVRKNLLRRDIRSTISFDAPIDRNEDGDFALRDTVFLAEKEDASSKLMKAETCKAIRDSWNSLSGADRKLLSLRYSPEEKTISLRQAEKIIGVSRETLRKKEKIAISNFRNNLCEFGVFA